MRRHAGVESVSPEMPPRDFCAVVRFLVAPKNDDMKPYICVAVRDASVYPALYFFG